MIDFINVTKEYSDTSALNNVSFHIENGEFVAPQHFSSSSQVSSMAEAALPTAGNTVLNRRRDTSR